MDVLFTGGACRDARSVQPTNLSRLRCKLFDCKDREQRHSGTTTSRYSDKVLTGNWYEERTIFHPPVDEWITVYNSHYKTHDVKDLKDDMFTIWKNREKTQGTGRKLPVDGDSYNDNMTSSNDLSFRILPRGLCGPRIRVYNARKNAWVPETELTLSYGNQTKYGLADAIKRKQKNLEEESYISLQSVYQIDYVKQIYPEDQKDNRFPKPRGDMNTPDLSHLGINLSTNSRPTAHEPQYRSSCCEKICTWL